VYRARRRRLLLGVVLVLLLAYTADQLLNDEGHVPMPSMTLPVAVTLTNFNPLLAPSPRARADVNANDHPEENA
jgi:hypothetical protein